MKTTRDSRAAGAATDRFASRYRASSAQSRSRTSLRINAVIAVARSGQEGTAGSSAGAVGAAVGAVCWRADVAATVANVMSSRTKGALMRIRHSFRERRACTLHILTL